jgi:hypothetical protein
MRIIVVFKSKALIVNLLPKKTWKTAKAKSFKK